MVSFYDTQQPTTTGTIATASSGQHLKAETMPADKVPLVGDQADTAVAESDDMMNPA